MFSYFMSAFLCLTWSNFNSFFSSLQSHLRTKYAPQETDCGSSLHLFPVSEHWDYHPHPHPHPVEFENLPETNFTELQSVQALHPPCHPVRYDTESLIDPNLGAHPHVLQQSVSPPVGQTCCTCCLQCFILHKAQFDLMVSHVYFYTMAPFMHSIDDFMQNIQCGFKSERTSSD